MSDAETSSSPDISFKIRHGFMRLWIPFRELPASIVLVMIFFLIAQFAVSYISL